MKRIDTIILLSMVLVLGLVFYRFSSETPYPPNIDKAISRLKKGDYTVIRTHILPLARAGDARAQFDLGVAYMLGHGVEVNFEESFKWTEKAAIAGDKRAQVNLANLYMDGRGTVKNPQQAIKWYTQAAINNDVYAQLSLGKIYRDGVLLPQNYNRAYEYLSSAAAAGNLEAKYHLAEFHLKGWGVTKDGILAQSIYEEVAKAGYNSK